MSFCKGSTPQYEIMTIICEYISRKARDHIPAKI